jgi:hypothetical protein
LWGYLRIRPLFLNAAIGALTAPKNGGYALIGTPVEYLNIFAVASTASARRNFAQGREQYSLVRERLARNSNAAIAVRSRRKMVATP